MFPPPPRKGTADGDKSDERAIEESADDSSDAADEVEAAADADEDVTGRPAGRFAAWRCRRATPPMPVPAAANADEGPMPTDSDARARASVSSSHVANAYRLQKERANIMAREKVMGSAVEEHDVINCLIGDVCGKRVFH